MLDSPAATFDPSVYWAICNCLFRTHSRSVWTCVFNSGNKYENVTHFIILHVLVCGPSTQVSILVLMTINSKICFSRSNFFLLCPFKTHMDYFSSWLQITFITDVYCIPTWPTFKASRTLSSFSMEWARNRTFQAAVLSPSRFLSLARHRHIFTMDCTAPYRIRQLQSFGPCKDRDATANNNANNDHQVIAMYVTSHFRIRQAETGMLNVLQMATYNTL